MQVPSTYHFSIQLNGVGSFVSTGDVTADFNLSATPPTISLSYRNFTSPAHPNSSPQPHAFNVTANADGSFSVTRPLNTHLRVFKDSEHDFATISLNYKSGRSPEFQGNLTPTGGHGAKDDPSPFEASSDVPTKTAY